MAVKRRPADAEELGGPRTVALGPFHGLQHALPPVAGKLRARLGRNARKTMIERHVPFSIANQIVDVYQSVLAAGATGQP